VPGTILSINPFGAVQLGYTVGKLTGRSVLSPFHEADRETLRETQMELAHVNRVTTMGQQAASIVHEVDLPSEATAEFSGSGEND
jgi:C4-dicarboxylate-specific signal transduction histidine kinase